MQVIVHHLEQARLVLEVARELGVDVELRSAPDAAACAGVGYLHALAGLLGRELLVDCGEDAGLVMAGLRAGCRKLAYGGPDELFQRLADMAGQVGGVLRHEPVVPDALALAPDDDRPRILARLSETRAVAAATPRPPSPS